ncbi:MAG: hypothetical protein RJA35_719 [Actinomycetota bacterium]
MSIRKLSVGVGIAALIAAAVMTPSASQAAPKAAATAPVVRIGYFGNLTHAPALIARQQKLFEKYLPGSKIQYTYFTVGTAEIEALKGGALDFGYIGPGPAISGYVTTQGSLLNIVAGATYGGARFVVKPNLIANEGSPTKAEIAALAGKTIADPGVGGTQDIALKNYLKDNGLGANNQYKVNITGLANADTLTAFLKGSIDGAWVPEPWATRLIQEGHAKTFVDENDLWANGKYATTLVVASKAFEKQYPAAVQGLVQANEDAVNYLRDASNKPDAINLVQNELVASTGKKLAPQVISYAWDSLKFSDDPIIPSVVANFNESVEQGILPGAKLKNIKGIFNLTFVNKVRKAQTFNLIQVPANLK